jgi:hypothetical protein
VFLVADEIAEEIESKEVLHFPINSTSDAFFIFSYKKGNSSACIFLGNKNNGSLHKLSVIL